MGKSKRRFSYLLLEDREFYVQDWMATCRPALKGGSLWMQSQLLQQRKLKGRLRLCSKSIFFEPDNVKVPIIKFPLHKVNKIESLSEPLMSPSPLNSKWSRKQECFVMETLLHVKIKEGGLDTPYVFEKQESSWWFSLEFAPVKQFLLQAQSLVSINHLPHIEKDMVLRNTMAQKEAQAKFDTSRLVDLTEEIFLDCPAARVMPLVREPGRLVLTQSRLYFQPLHNLNNDSPVQSQTLDAVVAVARRRHAFRQIGLEIFFRELDALSKNISGTGLSDGASIFFTFSTADERERAAVELFKKLEGRTGVSAGVGILDANGLWMERVMRAWQERLISNYDYLIYLNLVAGRSFCDLTQWPVMPWILADYSSPVFDLKDPKTFRDLSKPIGALNHERLIVFQERYAQMLEGEGSDLPFLYGTHYSTPGYVLYWLVRSAPAHMLRLQNGRFDAPDRLFISIRDSWESVLNNPADLKELIPEFFAPPVDFLLMREGLNLGIRQNGETVGDVQLPPWARNAEDFIVKHREALESEHVSSNIHLWIDLIFGFRQQGEDAIAANNIFHPFTYEGVIDLEKIDDPTQRASLEAQINEFGQAPRQLFFHPHFQRFPGRSVRTRFHSRFQCASTDEGFRVLNADFISSIVALASRDTESGNWPVNYTELRSPMSPLRIRDFMNDNGVNLSRLMSMSKGTHDYLSPNFKQRPEDYSPNQSVNELEDEQKYLRMASLNSNYSFWDNLSPASTAESDSRDNELKNSQEEGSIPDYFELSMLLKSSLYCEDASPTPKTWKAELFDEGAGPSSVSKDKADKENGENYSRSLSLRHGLPEPRCFKMHRGAVHAVILSEGNDYGFMYSVGQDSFLKVYSISDGNQIRATKLGDLPLSSLALASSFDASPIVLAGSYDDCLYAYSVDYGRAVGKIRVHDETVSCVRFMENSLRRVITASWDATVKIWSLDEGRVGSSSLLDTAPISNNKMGVPEAEFLEHDGAIISLDVEQNGQLVVSGAEDGSIIAWDLRNPTSSLWHQYNKTIGPVAGIRLTSDTGKVVVAFGDGSLHVLDARQNGACIATNECETSLRCCELAGEVVLAGSVDGTLHFCPLSSSTTYEQTDETALCADYTPIHIYTEAINCISVSICKNGCIANLATAFDDGSIQLYSFRP